MFGASVRDMVDSSPSLSSDSSVIGVSKSRESEEKSKVDSSRSLL
jgi:hypothetical protein